MASSILFSARTFVLLTLVLLLFSAVARADDDAAADAVAEDMAADLAAEEAAAAAVEEAAEDEEDDDADALDEDADAARYDPERRHPLSEMPPPATDVHVGHAFTSGFAAPESSGRDVVTLGEPVKTLVAFSNRGRSLYHVWGVMGSLNMDNDFRVYVQNFTYSVVNKTVGARGELSFGYKFTPNERLDTRPFQLAITVFYEAQSSSGNAIRGHSTTFFNATVATVPGPQTMSNSLFMFLFFTVVAAAGGAWYLFMTMEAAKKEAVETGTEDASKNEWLEEHHNMVRTGGGRARSRTNGRK